MKKTSNLCCTYKNGFFSLIFSLLILLIMYYPIFLKLVSDWWNDPNYSHGFLIPIISLYLIWDRRNLLKDIPLQPSGIGLFITCLAGLLFLIGQIAGEQFTQRISFIIALSGIIISFGGHLLWKYLWLPITYLIFMVPLPYILYNSIAFPLKLIATKISTFVLQFLDITIYSEGNLIYLPHITLEVADACSGIRSLISVLALSVIISIYFLNSRWKRFLLILLSILIVVLCNMLRIIITGIIASKNPELATGFFHSFSGELIFLTGVAIVFIVALLMGKNKKNSDLLSVDIVSNKSNKNNKRQEYIEPKIFLIRWIAPFTLLIFYIINLLTIQAEAIPINKKLSAFPEQIDGFYKLEDLSLNEAILQNLGVDNYIMRSYRGPDSYPLWLYIGYYEEQKEGAMIHSPKHCYPGGGWLPLSSRIIDIMIPETGNRISINEYILQKGHEKQLVYYWYQSRGRTIANEYKDRAYMILDSIFKRRSDGALIRISGPANDLEKARELQRTFIRSLYPILIQFIPS